MIDPARNELEVEWNAQFDDERERYAGSLPDPDHEGYCGYLDDCEQAGTEPLGFEAWKAGLSTPAAAPPAPLYGPDEDIPF